tara:strand:+ start:286 stop:1005 length:720 start_codon:yes stop_codon:yes gene_type:complete
MATSNTYTFNPSLGEMVLYAYNLIGIRNTAVLQEHMEAARMASNMLCARWSNQGVNLWAVDLVTTPLVTGTATYAVDSNTVMILDAYVQNDDSGANIDRIILPVSRTEYASYPNKEQQGYPTVYWFDRLISASRSTGSAGPSVTLWPVPNTDNGPQSLKYYRVRQIQDSALTNGQTVEIPFLWLEAFAYGLAMRLAQIWNPAAVAMIKPMADESYQIAAEQNIETASYFISPMVSGYFR